ncbi:PilW family protein [Pseudoxanthomonas koreensis]|uniref:PilW family protein n=1 Tax=Pseudoxanthomonas koreensis TaxID=266061 RepID=UPI0035A63267
MGGLTLIELMIALLIGSMLVLGLVQVFGAARSAYQLSEGIARVQENGRFALDFLQRDIRMAGHFGCVNDQSHRQVTGSLTSHFAANGPLDFGFSIRGYENSNPAGITLNPGRVGGTDVIVLRFLRGTGVPVHAIDPVAGTIDIPPAQWDALTEGGVANPTMFGIADCSFADVFAAQSVAAGAGRVTAPAGIDLALYGALPGGGPAMLYRADVVVYYVGNGAGGRPSLWRARVAPGGGVTSEELVEGIENLQFRYGLDQGPADALTGYVATQANAAGVGGAETDWRRVGQVQIGVLAVSPNPAAAPQATVAPPRVLDATPTLPTDGRYRAVYESTIALRNRLYGQ